MNRFRMIGIVLLTVVALPAALLLAYALTPDVSIEYDYYYVGVGDSVEILAEDLSGTYITSWDGWYFYPHTGYTILDTDEALGTDAWATVDVQFDEPGTWYIDNCANNNAGWDYGSTLVHVYDVQIDDVNTPSAMLCQDPNGVTIYYSALPTNLSGDLSLTIRDASQTAVRTIDIPDTKGYQSYTWDGKDANNVYLDPGQYTATVTLTVSWVPFTVSDSHTIVVASVVIDDFEEYFYGVDAGTIEYTIEPNSLSCDYAVDLIVADYYSDEVIKTERLATNTGGLGEQTTVWNGTDSNNVAAPYSRYTATIQLCVDNDAQSTLSDSCRITKYTHGIEIDTSNDGIADTYGTGNPPGLVVPVNLEGDLEGQDMYPWLSVYQHPSDEYETLTLNADSGIRIRYGNQELSLPASVAMGETYHVDGVTVGGPYSITLTYDRTGEVVQQYVYVTKPVSYCPTNTVASVWRPGPESGGDYYLADNDADLFEDIVTDQGYTVSWYTDETSMMDSNFGGCSLVNFILLRYSSMLHMISFPNGYPTGFPVVFSCSETACTSWKGAQQGMSVVNYDGSLYCVVVSGSWFEDTWASDLNDNNAIVHWATGSSSSYMDDAGGRWRIGYNTGAGVGDCNVVTEKLLTHMDGTHSSHGSAYRTAGEAYAAENYGDAVVMHGNGWTTLCPAPISDGATWPETPLTGDGACWVGIIFDTYIDDSVNASYALTSPQFIGTDERVWVPTPYGSYGVGCVKTIHAGAGHGTATAVAEYCTSGGKEMDGDRVSPNGDDVTWSF